MAKISHSQALKIASQARASGNRQKARAYGRIARDMASPGRTTRKYYNRKTGRISHTEIGSKKHVEAFTTGKYVPVTDEQVKMIRKHYSGSKQLIIPKQKIKQDGKILYTIKPGTDPNTYIQKLPEELPFEKWTVAYGEIGAVPPPPGGTFDIIYSHGQRTRTFDTKDKAKQFIDDLNREAETTAHRISEARITPQFIESLKRQEAFTKLQNQGLITVERDRKGKQEYQLIKPLSLLTKKELELVKKAGGEIPQDIKRSFSESYYKYLSEELEKLGDTPKTQRGITAKQILREYKIYSTPVIGKIEEKLFGPLKAIAKKIPGKQPFEEMTVVSKKIIEETEKLSPAERRQLTLQVAMAGFASTIVRDIPVGTAIGTIAPALGGLAGKTGRYSNALLSPITSKVTSVSGKGIPEAVKTTKNIVKKFGSEFVAKHPKVVPRTIELTAWGVSLGLEREKVIGRIKRGDEIGRIAEDVFIDLASMVGTDVAIRTGLGYTVPIKHGKVEIPLQGGGKAKWTGFYLNYEDDVRRLTGSISLYDDAGKLIHKTDDLETLAQKGVKIRYVPETKIQTKVTIDAMKKLGYTDETIGLVNNVRDVVFQTQDIQSKYIKKFFPAKTNTLDEVAMSNLKKFFLNNVDEIDEVYGSYATRNQLNEAYEFMLEGKSALRVPGDIDIMIRGSSDDLEDFANRLTNNLKKGGARVRINPNNPTLIEAYVGGDKQWAHAVDIHAVGEGLGATKTGLAWGFKLQKGTITIEGLPAQKLGEQGIRKGVSILGFQEGFELGPLAHRIKDIPDFVQVQQTLIDSSEWWSSGVQDKLNQIKEYYGVVNVADILDTYDEVVKVALQFGPDATASGLNIYSYLDSVGLAGYVTALGLPSMSSASRSTGLSKQDISILLNSGFSMSEIYGLTGTSFGVYNPPSITDVSYYNLPSITKHSPELEKILSSLGISSLVKGEPIEIPSPTISPPSVDISPLITPLPPSVDISPPLTPSPPILKPPTDDDDDDPILLPQDKDVTFKDTQIPRLGKRGRYKITLQYTKGSSKIKIITASNYIEAISKGVAGSRKRVKLEQVEAEKIGR